MIRCVVETYDDVLEYSATLDEQLMGTTLRPETHLIADQTARESDGINDPDQLSVSDDQIIELLELGHEGPALLGRLAQNQRQALHSLVEEVFHLSEGDPTRMRARLADMYRASSREDRQGLNATLAFLLDFEWLLRTYLIRAWTHVFGLTWRDDLSNLFLQADPEKGYANRVLDPDRWSLGDSIYMAKLSANAAKMPPEQAMVIGGRFRHELGENWEGQLQGLLALRNTFAHGHLRRISFLDDFDGAWGKSLRQLIAAAALYYPVRATGR